MYIWLNDPFVQKGNLRGEVTLKKGQTSVAHVLSQVPTQGERREARSQVSLHQERGKKELHYSEGDKGLTSQLFSSLSSTSHAEKYSDLSLSTDIHLYICMKTLEIVKKERKDRKQNLRTFLSPLSFPGKCMCHSVILFLLLSFPSRLSTSFPSSSLFLCDLLSLRGSSWKTSGMCGEWENEVVVFISSFSFLLVVD